MKPLEPKTFQIPELKGISAKTIEEHLKLYQGYVTHTNLVLAKINELSNDSEGNIGIISGLQRRFGFEYNGMRNHEVYFDSFSGGSNSLQEDSDLKKMISSEWGSFEKWLTLFKSIATIRGVGWAMLYYDRQEKRLFNAWVDEQHFGQLQNCTLVLALDMWEHSYVADYLPSGKKQYVEDYFASVNWSVVEKRYQECL